jgi:hypothetical protein
MSVEQTQTIDQPLNAASRATAVLRYCAEQGDAVLVTVRSLTEDVLTWTLPSVVVVDPLVDLAAGAFAWIDGDGSTGTVHAVVIEELWEDGDGLRLAGSHGTGETRELTLSPLETPEQQAVAVRLRAEFPPGAADAALGQAVAGAVELAAHVRETRPGAQRRFAVAAVARLADFDGGKRELAFVGAFAVAEDGDDWSLASLPAWSQLGAEFEQRVRRASAGGRTPLELLEYLVDHGNGITVDYSQIERVGAQTALSAAYGFLRRHLAKRAPHLVR